MRASGSSLFLITKEIYSIIWATGVEIFIHRYILAHREKTIKKNRCQWAVILLARPVLIRLANFIFSTASTWAILVHMMRGVTTWKYVVAPKALYSGSPKEQKIVVVENASMHVVTLVLLMLAWATLRLKANALV